MRLTEIDGRELRTDLRVDTEVVVVGSGPAGASAARTLARGGSRTVVVEEGDEPTGTFPESGFEAMARWYRDLGMTIALGPAIIPYLQGRAVGGTSVINGAICWRLPRDVYDEWARLDPALREALPAEAIAHAEAELDDRLGVAPTSESVAGSKNLLLAKGATELGLEHRPIRRNAPGCRGSGRCLQGCPNEGKASVDRTLLRDAVTAGARVLSGVRVEAIVLEGGHAKAIVGRTRHGVAVTVRANRAVVLAASAIQTPILLRESGLTRGPVGDHLMAHPGVSVVGQFPSVVDAHLGATQGHEVIGLRKEGIKIEALGFDHSILASRLPGVGRAFAASLDGLRSTAAWGAAIRAKARGSVRSARGKPLVRYALTTDDVRLVRRGAQVLSELFFAAGAHTVAPGILGMPSTLGSLEDARSLGTNGPLDARAYSMSMTHLFGTARLGSNPSTSVVDLDFEHHDAKRLFVADSSVFPSNTGVNPMISIMAVAQLCANRVLERS